MRRWRVLTLVAVTLGTFAIPVAADWYTAPRSGLGHLLPTTELTVDGTVDLDGDGGVDLIQSTDERYLARSGASGRVLWSAPWGPGHTERIYVARIGSPARPGVVVAERVVVMERTGPVPPVWYPRMRRTSRLTYTAYDGATGAQLWQVEREGQYWNHSLTELSTDWREEHVPALLEAVTGRGGRAALFLFTERSTDSKGHPTEQYFRISGASGAVTGLAEPGDAFGTADQLRDIDRDGYAEISVMTSHLVVLSGRTGRTLWDVPEQTPRNTNFLPAAEGIPDLTGDDVPDVAIFRDNDDVESQVVLNGKTGRKLWSSPTYLTRTGDIDGDGFTDFLRHAAVRDGDGYDGRFTALSGHDGTRIWRRTLSNDGNPAGDVDDDGLDDFYVETGRGSRAHHYVVSGKDGSLTDGRDLPRPLYASVDRVGDDFFRMQRGDALDVRVRAGNGRRALLWTYHRDGKVIDNRAVSTHFWTERFSSDRRADIMILTYGEDRDRMVMLDGRDGHVRWSISGPASY